MVEDDNGRLKTTRRFTGLLRNGRLKTTRARRKVEEDDGVSEGVAKDEQAIIVSCRGCFHGRTLAAISMSCDNEATNGFGPLLSGYLKVDFGDKAALEKNFKGLADCLSVVIMSYCYGIMNLLINLKFVTFLNTRCLELKVENDRGDRRLQLTIEGIPNAIGNSQSLESPTTLGILNIVTFLTTLEIPNTVGNSQRS
ncbi:hypothetical protein Ddye_008139 [Dipteronia dyeriana]|uniref:Uncharacterized protein n=1 Tax=Dipteronia dyeriana TaxID=168575 RepID=A0AAD9X992_9ROSI|nr:hypothetical protein Ddye_008139 [Dipteronia dyeriana]